MPVTGRSAVRDGDLDKTDLRILELLRDDGRVAIASLARDAHISRANAYTRLQRLLGDGVIEGFSARVNSEKVGLSVTAVVLLSFRQGEWRKHREVLASLPEVQFCGLTTGAFDALLLIRVKDIQSLRQFILEKIQSLPTLRTSQTILVMDEVLNRPYVLN
jgi:DNA-binding Lrp family transcriptional regulator